MFKLDFNSPVPLYAQLKDQVLNLISSGKIQKSEKLPSVRELSRELKINPNTVTQCYRELENEGILFTKKGQGTFVSSEVKPMSKSQIKKMLKSDVEALCVKANHLGTDIDDLISFVREASGKLKKTTDKEGSGHE